MATFLQRFDRDGVPTGWQAKVRRKGYAPESKTFSTKKDAEIWARDMEGKIDRREFTSTREADTTTLSEALDRYETAYTEKKKGAYQEKGRIRRWKASELGGRALSKITGRDLEAWIKKRRREDGSSNATLRLDLMVIQALYTKAIKKWGLKGLENPVATIEVPSPNGNDRDRRLEKETKEEERLFTQLQKSPYWWAAPVARLAIETCARQGELLGLTWENVNVRERWVHLDKTKNGEERTIPLSTAAVAVLESIPRVKKGRVFPCTQWRLRRTWEQACRDAKIDDLHFHDLRHEGVSRLAETGKFDILELKAVSGHKTTKMLERYVNHRIPHLLAKFA